MNIHDLSPERRQRWAAARVWAAHQAPYLATAVLALDPVVVTEPEGLDLRGFPVDPDYHVYIDPEVLAATELPVVGFWLLHQVTHLLRQHAARFPVRAETPEPAVPAPTRTPQQHRWNLAADAEINDDLRAGEVTVPPETVTPAQLALPDGWTAEQYWDALGGESHAFADCGSGADGRPRPWDCGRPGLSGIAKQMLGRDVARRIQDHQKRRGDVPSGWQRWAEDLLVPTVNWRRQLAAAVRRGVADVAGRVDFTYRRPSRRAAAVPDVVLPSLRQPLPQVAMVLDTSGSMSDQMLAQALGEVGGVLRSLGLGRRNLRVICCDAQAYAHQRVLDARDVRLLGGGGTDMGKGLAAAADLRPRPDLAIVLTDGHTPWPSRAPDGMRVVVGLMDSEGRTPDWATTVVVGDDLAGSR
jgi:predicted metal-dependent peptidase